MKIKSIKLHNFMRYKGENELEFSMDGNKNVTVVLGDNTLGKTTLAQAFRWGLYGEINDTNYSKRKDVVLLNNEVAAQLFGSKTEYVSVEIVIVQEQKEIRFVRKALFNKKSADSSDISVKQIGVTQLTMQINEKNKGWGDIIDNSGGNIEKKYKVGCVQETIDNLLPHSLSNYFFFDGERWNDGKNKTNDIRESVENILGVSGLVQMMNHLLDHRMSVSKKFRERIKGSGGEYERLQREIKGLEDSINDYNSRLNEIKEKIETEERIIESTQKILNDNRKVEEDQKELQRLENDIDKCEKFKTDYYADIVKALSNSSKYYASLFLPELETLLESVDLEGRDIPGVTVDTIDYLIEHKECLCGNLLIENSDAYENMIKLRKQVPPEMLGGAAGKLKTTLENWANETSDLQSFISEKAESYDLAQDTIDEKTEDKNRLEKIVDRKTNLGPVRLQNKQAKERINSLRNEKANYEMRIEHSEDSKRKKEKDLDTMAIRDKENARVYRCLAYIEAMYKKASEMVKIRKVSTIRDLNQIIGDNFKKMFNDHEKYAKLENDYKIHVYYYQVGDKNNVEEEVLSNGEMLAINFVFIVSILELAKKYKDLEIDDKDYGMKNAILELPLVLDAPFSALSNDNTALVAQRLPQFAEQVIVFMLDKDWEASGLEDYTLPQYCYRVNKETTSNSSSLEHD